MDKPLVAFFGHPNRTLVRVANALLLVFHDGNTTSANMESSVVCATIVAFKKRKDKKVSVNRQ